MPKFPIETWNCYRAATGAMPKTNNAVEGWHTGFEATLNAMHPNIFKLVQAFHREQTTAEVNTEFVIAGQPLPKRKKVYVDMAARIQNLVNKFPTDEDNDSGNDESIDEDNDEYSSPILKYLRGLAHNISYG